MLCTKTVFCFGIPNNICTQHNGARMRDSEKDLPVQIVHRALQPTWVLISIRSQLHMNFFRSKKKIQEIQ